MVRQFRIVKKVEGVMRIAGLLRQCHGNIRADRPGNLTLSGAIQRHRIPSVQDGEL